ncbi:MAG TPA: restriction endonuclease [Deinococcales bacterium]|nr:restriction endonuclease [Deinococcales bacterium]
MPVPDFQTIMRPLLEILAEQSPLDKLSVQAGVADRLGVTAEQQHELIPSGITSRFASNCGWAASHLVQAGALTRPGRGELAITERGLELLQASAGPVTMKRLMTYPEYRVFRGIEAPPVRELGGEVSSNEAEQDAPEEAVRLSATRHRNAIAADLLDRLKNIDPTVFEKVVLELLVKLGYGTALHTGRSGDGGIDGLILMDRLGLDRIYVQAKRWKEATVGRPVVNAFHGSVNNPAGCKMVLVTTSLFTDDAKKFAEEAGMALVDGPMLAELMLDARLGVHVEKTYPLFSLDFDYFGEVG